MGVLNKKRKGVKKVHLAIPFLKVLNKRHIFQAHFVVNKGKIYNKHQ
jgi:hypothetical protein